MIFCFAGTGNSLYAAKQLDPELISIPQTIHNDRLTFEADSIGILCPVYGHEMPAMVKEFLRKADIYSRRKWIRLAAEADRKCLLCMKDFSAA